MASAVSSMTGFASVQGSVDGTDWVLEVRSVNARGLDIRLRLPEGAEGLEPAIRSTFQKRLTRGSVQVSLKLAANAEAVGVRLDAEGLREVLAAATDVVRLAREMGVDLAPMSVGEVLGNRAVLDTDGAPDRGSKLREAVAAQLDSCAGALVDARAVEGAAMGEILRGQLSRVSELMSEAEVAVGDRAEARTNALRERVTALLEAQDRVDGDRLAQELALIAVKADVSEELDRLRAHVDHARTLLDQGGPVGRKLEFLMQEFNREANTLCSKSQDSGLTTIGLDMKVVIDQMREQAANIE